MGAPRHGDGRSSILSSLDVDGEVVELLPRRSALGGLVDITTVVPVNIAIAVNAATFGSTAAAAAWQRVGVRA